MVGNIASTDNQEGGILKQPLCISELLSGGSQFEIDTDFERLPEELFDDNISDDDEERDFDSSDLASPWIESFDNLRKNMIKVNDYVYKRQVKEGRAGFNMPENARVTIEYTSYAEFSTHALDSTYMRGHSHTFFINTSEILPGIEMAVKTMLQGEESQFILSYQVLFGEMGCPPRIKPKSDYLYVIKLIKFTDVGDLNAIEKIPEENRNKFSVVFPKIKEVHKKGLHFFQLSNIQAAVKAFHNCANKLNFCNVIDEAEEKEQIEFLGKLYVNLTVCYMKLDNPGKVCKMCNELRKITNIDKYPKALYNEGKALRKLGEFQRAKKSLNRAHNLLPNNQEIVEELGTLAKTFENYQKNEKEICVKAMGSVISSKTESKKEINNDIFEKEIEITIKDFKNNLSINKLILPHGLSSKEIDCIEKLTKEFELKLSIDPLDNSMIIIKNNK